MLDRAREVNPSETWLLVNQGVLYALSGKRSEAEEALNRIIRESVKSVRYHGQLFIYSAMGNLDGAFKALMKPGGDTCLACSDKIPSYL
jgi:Flp pilus assembly protein TadD